MTMQIRPAAPADIEVIAALGQTLHAESVYRAIPYDADKVRAQLDAWIGADAVCVVVAEQDGAVIGGFVGVAYEHYFSRERTACDLALYVRPDRRGGLAAVALVRAFEAWAKAQGCPRVQLGISAGINPGRVEALYRRLGYAPFSVAMTKEV